MWERILSVWDNGGRNIKLDKAELIDMNPLSGDSRFNTDAQTAKKKGGSKICMNGWLKHLSKDGLLKN